MLKKVSISDLEKNCEKLFKKLEGNEDSGYVVMENNRPLAVIISWKRYRGFRETLALAQPYFDARIKKVVKDHKRGRWMTGEEVMKKLGVPLTKEEREKLRKFRKSDAYREREKLKRQHLKSDFKREF